MTNPAPSAKPTDYLLTFHTYGTWLPGDDRGWHHRGDGAIPRPPAPGLRAWCERRMNAPPLWFSARQRRIVRDAFREPCARRGFPVHALSVQTAHVHLVVTATVAPEALMASLKGWATRALRSDGLAREQTIWAEHGSTRRLLSDERYDHAIGYTNDVRHRPEAPCHESDARGERGDSG